MFSAASDYHELNAGAHRKPPKILNPPALVWHLAFWTNAGQRDKKGQEPDLGRIKDALDNFILALRKSVEEKVGEVELMPRISGVYLLFNNVCDEKFSRIPADTLKGRRKDIFTSTSRAVSLQFIWKKLDVTVRFEISDEYCSMSTFVELNKDRSGSSYSDLAGMNRNIEIVLGRFKDSNGSSPQQVADVQELNKYFFHDFWKYYEDDVLSNPSLAGIAGEGAFQRVVADFRGFILSEQAIQFSDDAEFFDENKPPKWGHEAKNKLLPLIQHRDRAQRTRYECAVNYLLDGRAIYLSTLGPQLPSTPEGERIPVEFIVYAPHQRKSKTIVNKWQLGRLVNQILLLGTLRLSALKDIKLLHEAGVELGLLDESTQDARQAIASSDKKAMDAIGEAHKNLSRITGKFLEETGCGLLYRIERSRYYVQQFDDNVKLLRIKRIEGDQPYDQFIRRRLGSEFDFIDRLGRRYERATANMVTLDQNYLAITQNALVEKTNRIDEEANSIQSDIHKIQEWGEFILLAALVPYYVVHLLVLLVGEGKFFVPAMTLCVWTVFFTIALYRKSSASPHFKNDRALIVLFFFLGLTGSILLFFYSYDRRPAHETSEAQKRTAAPANQEGHAAAQPAVPSPKP
jgi:hypothetical protein